MSAQDTTSQLMKAALESAYSEAEALLAAGTAQLTGSELEIKAQELGVIKSAARGVALTLCAYKSVVPDQDVRAHKSEHIGGFSARAFDSRITVPFLIAKDLPRSTESHWLSQTYSFAGPYLPGTILKTQPTRVGPLLIEVVNAANVGAAEARAASVAILTSMIQIRNSSRVILTKPKDLPINRVLELVRSHISRSYAANGPRLPQLALYAAYRVLVRTIGRFSGQTLEPLERLKAADRKRGTIGDVVVSKLGSRTEAIEIKHDQPIKLTHVLEAINKIKGETVRRYYLLSNVGIHEPDADQIKAEIDAFLRRNGCEIIVNGVLESLGYYLRMMPDTDEFIFEYTSLVESDEDTAFEHRQAWNDICDAL